MAITITEEKINNLKIEIIDKVSIKLAAITEGTTDVAIAWKKMQDVAALEIINILNDNLENSVISSPVSKSTYPDIKIVNDEGHFAIDIKVNETSKEPWFDMARLDTMLVDRLGKYVEEWEFVIRFDSTTGSFIKAYFNLFRDTVGIRLECNGIKYRPYDGKVRPKNWKDFDNDVSYFNSKTDFLEGIEKSIKHRWKENIKKHLTPKLSAEEKVIFKNLFD